MKDQPQELPKTLTLRKPVSTFPQYNTIALNTADHLDKN